MSNYQSSILLAITARTAATSSIWAHLSWSTSGHTFIVFSLRWQMTWKSDLAELKIGTVFVKQNSNSILKKLTAELCHQGKCLIVLNKVNFKVKLSSFYISVVHKPPLATRLFQNHMTFNKLEISVSRCFKITGTSSSLNTEQFTKFFNCYKLADFKNFD